MSASPWTGTAKPAGGGQFEIPEEGSHPAVCVALIDLGTHEQEFKDQKTGEIKKASYRKILMVWELTNQGMSDTVGKNHVIGKDYNLAFTDKSGLRKMLERWRGKVYGDGEPIDPGAVLGKSCLVTVTHGKSQRNNAYAKFDGVSPVPKGLAVPKAKIKPVTWKIGDDAALPTWLPWIYGESPFDVIQRSQEVRAMAQPRTGLPLEEPGDQAPEDDIPAGDDGDSPF